MQVGCVGFLNRASHEHNRTEARPCVLAASTDAMSENRRNVRSKAAKYSIQQLRLCVLLWRSDLQPRGLTPGATAASSGKSPPETSRVLWKSSGSGHCARTRAK
jgi:hypothetical protein